MKKITIVFLTILISMSAFAQIGKVEEINGDMSKGKNRGLKVLIPEVTEKEAIKAWSKLMKSYDSKTSRVKKNDDYLSENAKIPSLSENEINVYSLFNETPEGVFMNVFIDLGGAYLNSDMHPEITKSAKDLIHSFATKIAREAVEAKLKEEEKKLDKLNKEQKNLANNKEGYEKDIKDAETTIEKRTKEIGQNIKDQETKQREIKDQKQEVEKVKAKVKKY